MRSSVFMMAFFLKIIIFTCAFFVPHIVGQAQVNYVLNPSFEEYNTCPWNVDQIKYATYWEPIDTSGPLKDTIGHPLCSPEYCNVCASIMSLVNVPNGGWYYHYARTGNGMAQMVMYFDESIPSWGYKRDYLQGHLYKPLTAGKSYCVTFYVAGEQTSGYAINHIGAYLDDGSIDKGQDSLGCAQPQTGYTPQIVTNSFVIDTLATDTTEWLKIQGSIVANGTERFITIGNFFDVSHTDTIGVSHIWEGSWWNRNPTSLYLIDDVSVIESDNVPDAGKDTSIAKGDSVFLGPHEIALPYWWYKLGNPVAIDSGGGIWVKPDSSTTYVLEQNLCGVLSYDSVTVNPTLDVSNLLNERSVKIYPNPAKNEITIENSESSGEGEVRIFNVVGQEVFYAKLNSKKQQLDISKLVVGTYILQVTANDGSRTNKVIEKER